MCQDIPDLHSLHLSPMDHNISTLGPAVVGFIPHAPFLEILGRSPRLAHVFWRETFVDSSVFREWVVNLGQRDALNRVAHMLCEIATRLQAVGLARKDFSFTFPALQTDIADAVGISPVHTNRIIQDLRTKQLIEWKGKEIRIAAWQELVLLADFDDGYLHLR
jgi:CRP-like cAMP-binding protein